MATRTPKVLADGQLPSSQTTLYTVPASTSVYVSMINIVNTNASPQSVDFWINASGSARRLFHVDGLAQYERIEFEAGLILETGDIIQAQTNTASAVDYVITGVTEV